MTKSTKAFVVWMTLRQGAIENRGVFHIFSGGGDQPCPRNAPLMLLPEASQILITS